MLGYEKTLRARVDRRGRVGRRPRSRSPAARPAAGPFTADQAAAGRAAYTHELRELSRRRSGRGRRAGARRRAVPRRVESANDARSAWV